jgi:hypothetical protein
MAGPHLPLPTLHVDPHGSPRTARGQCDSLYLSLCKTFTHYSLPVSRRTNTVAATRVWLICIYAYNLALFFSFYFQIILLLIA